MSRFDKIAIYLFGTLLILGILFIGFQVKQVNKKLYDIEVRIDNLNSTLRSE
jgi:hypothetical protein